MYQKWLTGWDFTDWFTKYSYTTVACVDYAIYLFFYCYTLYTVCFYVALSVPKLFSESAKMYFNKITRLVFLGFQVDFALERSQLIKLFLGGHTSLLLWFWKRVSAVLHISAKLGTSMKSSKCLHMISLPPCHLKSCLHLKNPSIILRSQAES